MTTLDQQIAVIDKIKKYKVFEEELPILHDIKDSLYALKMFESADKIKPKNDFNERFKEHLFDMKNIYPK